MTAAVAAGAPPLWAHQRGALARLLPLPAGGLWAGMGSGKTRVALEMWRDRRLMRLLVLCPKAVVGHWGRQVNRWAPSVPVLSLGEGPVSNRAELLRRFHAGVVVANYDSLLNPVMLKAVASWTPEMLVLDEIQKLKAPNGKRSKNVAAIRAPYRLGLSGTPLAHSPLDAYGVYRALDPKLFGSSWVLFKRRYTEPCRWGEHSGMEIGRGGSLSPYRFVNLDELHQKMYSIAYQVNTRDVLDLPPEQDAIREVELESEAMRFYRKLDRDLTAELAGNRVTASIALVKLLRLQQVTSGCVRVDDGGSNVDDAVPLRKENLLEEHDVQGVLRQGAARPAASLLSLPEKASPLTREGVVPDPLPSSDKEHAFLLGGGMQAGILREGSLRSPLHEDEAKRGGGKCSTEEPPEGVRGIQNEFRLSRVETPGWPLRANASDHNGEDTRPSPQEVRASPSPEWDQERQPARELGAMGKAATSGEKATGSSGLGGGDVPIRDGMAIISTAKRRELEEFFSELPSIDEPVVVFCRFTSDIQSVHEAAKNTGRTSLELTGQANQLADWLRGESPVLAVQIQAGGLGVELHRARFGVFLSIGYSLTDYMQARGRLVRPEQTRPVLFSHLVAKGTVDEEVYRALGKREDLLESVLRTRR